MPNENAEKVLQHRVYQPNESWPGLCRRVAHAVGAHHGPAMVRKYEELLFNLDFLPNSPCLMGAGTPLQQLAACFVLPVGDSMEEIMQSLKDAAMIHKSGGGTGFSFSSLRGANQPVRSTAGVASGPVSFMKMFDAVTEQIKQGGRRKGANMGILRCDHPDIRQFLYAKRCEGNLNNFNLSVGITDELLTRETIKLRDPGTKQVMETVESEEILELIARQAWRNGEPGIVFLDTINRRRPMAQVERMEATNPCGEFPGLPYEPCTLGSINLANMVTTDGRIDWPKLSYAALVATMFLDDVITVNNYPLLAVQHVAHRNRKIGLGIMGLHSLLLRQGIPYDSSEGRVTARGIMQAIQIASHESSRMLGESWGLPAGCSKERNMTTTAIAPTGTLSLIGGCTNGCEPAFALHQERNLSDNQHYEEFEPSYREALNRHGAILYEELPGKQQEIFKGAPQIHWEDHLRMQATLQEHTDNGVSKTINMPSHSTFDDVKTAIRRGWELGTKGFTVYRDGSRDGQPVCELCT